MLSISVFPVSIYGEANGPDYIDFSIGKTPYRISLAAKAGVLLGQAEEIVYKYSDDDAYLSQLLWDLKPLVYLGSSLSLSRANPLAGLGAAVDLSVKFGLPILSGTMEDRDWHDPYVIGNTYDDIYLTNFSSSDAYIQGAMLLDFSGGITIPIASVVAIKALVSFSYMRFSWIAQNGYLQYMRENWEKRYVQGTLISYDQNWIILSPGIGVSWPFHRSLSLDFSFFISPLIWAWDMDTHFMTGPTQFYDDMKGGAVLGTVIGFFLCPQPIFFPGRP
ncbi:hypothetical protein AGMMS49944_03490 [Spirochaetia bacterium]|nr:hypothetical protein AGMMS49944_03490 [Spirochaetia bacterium]